MKPRWIVIPMLGLLPAALGTVYAAQRMDNDALEIASAKIDLAQAVTSAEQHVGGKASKAEYERHHGKWVFDVEVVKGKQVMDVKVSPLDGRVIAATEDRTDHDDGHDKAD